ncbi:MAG: DUF2148 domain-containing protein [Bacteroidota bacterium]|nr:DUF2148 domain-containing protein [Bacteroidota bacterium]
MSLIIEENIRTETIYNVAKQMAATARTAPKARGIDNLVIAIADKKEIEKISEAMKNIASRQESSSFFLRDANNILNADYLLLIGTRIKSINVQPCDLCGFPNCNEKNKQPDVPCIFNTNDLGIAIGSAVSVAANHRIDNRVMYSVGKAVVDIRLLGDDVKIVFGIPLSVSPKNPFFDRK